MRTSFLLLFGAVGAAGTLGGCFNLGVCDVAICDGAGGMSTSSGTMTTGTAQTGSSSTGIAAGCVPTATAGPKDATCGLFVDPVNGDDNNPGSDTSPKKTLGRAAGAWTSGQGIFVCSGALTDSSGVSLPAGVVLYGGLDCANGYKLGASEARTTLTPSAGEIPLKLLDGVAGTEVHSFAVTASAATAKGSSAIGMVVGDVSATLDNVDVTAGDGADGVPGTTPTDNVGSNNPNDSSILGNPGATANTTTPGTKNPGAPLKANPLCTSTGGSGGDGGEIGGGIPQAGVMGSGGSVAPTPNPNMFGLGGPGEDVIVCMAGHDGSPGDAVVDADGAHGPSSLGTIALDGFHGVAGAAGPDGKPGQGGGGGGGAKGKVLPDTRGASGGSGGAGGCGGKGATGGGAGGASFAVVVLGSTVPAFTNVTLHTGKGGDGGAGALGESGGVGGNRGTGGSGSGTPTTAAACDGGKGGAGSNGGSSGGGRGGHSIGIAYVSTVPSGGFSVQKKAAGSAGATVGTGVAADAGVSTETQQLSAN